MESQPAASSAHANSPHNLIAILMFSRIVAPMVWGWIADHREQRMAVVRLASFLTVAAFSGAFFGTSFWWLAVVMLLFSFFWHASLPLLEVFVMHHTAARPGAYGRVRLWGSLGFMASRIGVSTSAAQHAHPCCAASPCSLHSVLTSKRSSIITLLHALTKSCASFCFPSSAA